ncbi:hypothetical protein [Pseudomonas phage PIP]|nr:hypothetical protein [Pseudomonas phage PIP]
MAAPIEPRSGMSYGWTLVRTAGTLVWTRTRWLGRSGTQLPGEGPGPGGTPGSPATGRHVYRGSSPTGAWAGQLGSSLPDVTGMGIRNAASGLDKR